MENLKFKDIVEESPERSLQVIYIGWGKLDFKKNRETMENLFNQYLDDFWRPHSELIKGVDSVYHDYADGSISARLDLGCQFESLTKNYDEIIQKLEIGEEIIRKTTLQLIREDGGKIYKDCSIRVLYWLTPEEIEYFVERNPDFEIENITQLILGIEPITALYNDNLVYFLSPMKKSESKSYILNLSQIIRKDWYKK